MITTTDAANIIYRDCKVFGMEIYQDGQIPDGEIVNERITIHTKRQSEETYWNKCFIEINFSVPDKRGEANLVRLNEIEREALGKMDSVGKYNNSYYRYSVHSSSHERDISFKCHFVNVRILFEVMNIK